jgi:hypothetical protein
MVLFKSKAVEKILKGEKTQTRRVHKNLLKVGKVYAVRTHWLMPKNEAPCKILITRRFRQKLGEISPEDVKKEGYSSLEEFRREWEKIHGKWDPNQIVWVYEFKLVSPKKGKPSFEEGNCRL